jgi:hypothetical protein
MAIPVIENWKMRNDSNMWKEEKKEVFRNQQNNKAVNSKRKIFIK